MAASAREERRSEARSRTLKAATLIDALATAPDTCTIRNLSTGGAKLELDDARPVSTLFRLEIHSARRPAELVWQNGAHLGVRFLDSR